ncbi:unnamed protein product [Malus baccata var. baccata]
MWIKILSAVFTFGTTAFDAFLYPFTAGAVLRPYHIYGFHICGGGFSSRVMFDPSFDRLKMTLIVGSCW